MTRRVAGIVAEYNPFHSGHAYHLAEARRGTDAAAIVVVLSSHFVQRGEPACLDPQTRTAMALEGGADLVVELPVPFCCHNAGVFAGAAIDILAATGVVTDVVFGMEDREAPIETIASILLDEPAPFKEALARNLRTGLSFVESRSRAIDALLPGAGGVLSRPNNSLAVAYVRQILKARYPLEARPICRLGPGYHDRTRGRIMSATALREALKEGDRSALNEAMPEYAFGRISASLASDRCLADDETLWRTMRILFLREGSTRLASMAEMSEGIERAFVREARSGRTWRQFVDSLTSKRYPRGRIQRQAIHCLLGLDQETNRALQRSGPLFSRVLGANGTGRGLLREMGDRATIPFVSRGSEIPEGAAQTVERLRHVAGEIWEGLLPVAAQRDPFEPPLMI